MIGAVLFALASMCDMPEDVLHCRSVPVLKAVSYLESSLFGGQAIPEELMVPQLLLSGVAASRIPFLFGRGYLH